MSILALLRPESSFPEVWPAVTAARLDLLDRRKTSTRIREFEPEVIVHCAATGMLFPHVEWFDLIRFNVDLTVNLCECAAMLPRCHFIFIGTGLAYREQVRPLNEGDPLETLHPYGASKAAADLLVRSAAAEFALPLTILRPFSFTGVGDDPSRLFGTILRGAAAGVPVDLSACTQVRDHCSARDIAQGIVAAMTNCPMSGAEAAIYNLGSGRELPLRDLIEAVVDELQLPVGLRFGARGLRPFEPSYLVADVTRPRAAWDGAHGTISPTPSGSSHRNRFQHSAFVSRGRPYDSGGCPARVDRGDAGVRGGRTSQCFYPRCTRCLAALGATYEIIVVDTRTPRDDTPLVCARWGVRYLRRDGGDLYSHAIRTALTASRGRFVIIMDADGSHGPSFIPLLWAERDVADLVIASRYVPGGRTENPRILIWLSRAVNLVFRFTLAVPCADVSNSFRLYRGADVRALSLECENFDVVEEILVKLVFTHPGYRLKEVPFTFERRKAALPNETSCRSP